MTTPYDYYPAVLYAIDLISQGHTLTKACDLSNLPIGTFHRYIKNDSQLNELYVEADQRGGDAMADALIDIDNHKIHGHSDPKMAKVVSDNIKWVLSKRKPKEFGDRVQVDHSVTVDVAITTALDAARRRVPAALPAPDVIDVQASPVYQEYDAEDEAILRELLS